MPDKRKLGDEWIGWSAEDSAPEYNENKGIFLFFASLTCFLYITALLLLWYLVMPRFEQFGTVIHMTAFLIFAVIITFLTVISVFLLAVMNFGMKIPFKRTGSIVFYRYLLDGALKFGKIFGISRDRIGSSFVKVSNSMNTAGGLKVDGKDLLILLPRCLEKSVKEAITSNAENYGCKVSIVSGGEAARRIIFEMKPAAVLGIACERDLLSGIQDTAVHLPVLGIANQRPDGPCRNTVIDITELESTLSTICKNTEKLSG